MLREPASSVKRTPPSDWEWVHGKMLKFPGYSTRLQFYDILLARAPVDLMPKPSNQHETFQCKYCNCSPYRTEINPHPHIVIVYNDGHLFRDIEPFLSVCLAMWEIHFLSLELE